MPNDYQIGEPVSEVRGGEGGNNDYLNPHYGADVPGVGYVKGDDAQEYSYDDFFPAKATPQQFDDRFSDGADWWNGVVKSGATRGYGWVNADLENRSWTGGRYTPPAAPTAYVPDYNYGSSSDYYGREDEERWLPRLDDLVAAGVIPPRLADALRPLVPGGPDFRAHLRPQGGYRPLSRQTYNRLLPSDLEALEGTLSITGNRPQDFLAPYQQPIPAPQLRYGRRVRIG